MPQWRNTYPYALRVPHLGVTVEPDGVVEADESPGYYFEPVTAAPPVAVPSQATQPPPATAPVIPPASPDTSSKES
ncbi:MAG TPA: hypothetical protein VGP46_09820 [Acidimicrobiales bacterium]|jgi:hypothetical protein|nr:hypothetical protein [Acidimicrobiales bacterium]